jgi:hypothetical protein
MMHRDDKTPTPDSAYIPIMIQPPDVRIGGRKQRRRDDMPSRVRATWKHATHSSHDLHICTVQVGYSCCRQCS